MDVRRVFGADRPVVGMVHLPPLPGSPRYDGDRDRLHERARSDAVALEGGGIDAILVENYGDVPYYPDDVPKHTVASVTALARTVRAAVDQPLGVNVLRNDATAALSVAAAVDASFVRLNVHTGARVTDQGLLEGRAHETLRLRDQLEADVAVLADLDVKHSTPLGAGDREAGAMADAVERGLADGLIISGRTTGHEPAMADIEATVRRRDDLGFDAPVFVGSGVSADSVAEYLSIADGVIVGTALKEANVTSNPVDRDRVAALVEGTDR